MDSIWLFGLLAVAGGLFAFLWRRGYLARFAAYVQETREELRKCTWPSWDELKGSTVVVMVVTVMIGLFTVVTDGFFTIIFQWLTKASNS